MTEDERMNHEYKVGDEAIVVVRKEQWSYCVPINTRFTIERVGGDDLHFHHEGNAYSYSKRYVEPFIDGSKCRCPTATLMTQGCQCGGS